jgi:3D (Asp-Asp-Asp) domain-containing protein
MLASTMIPGSSAISLGNANMLKQEAKSRTKSRSQLPTEHTHTNRVSRVTRTTITKKRRPLGEFTMRAYTHYKNPPSRTASGTIPTHGRTIAVDPRVIPLGSVIEIEGIGKRIAEDTGNHVKGKKLDMFLPSVQACTQFGVQSRKVYLLD